MAGLCAAVPAPPRFGAAFTLLDLLEAPELGLRLLAGEAAVAHQVSGAHSIEIEKPSRWLAPDWIALTTGLRLRADTTAQRDLIAELDDAHIAALGFAVDIYFPDVPSALVSEAEKRGFPVFEVPIQTGFRAITSYVYEALRSNDVREYQKLLSMQRYLLDVLGNPRTRTVVIERLADFAGASALLLGGSGNVLSASDTSMVDAVRDIWAALTNEPRRVFQAEIADVQLAAAPIRASGRHGDQWLVLVSKTGWAATRLALRILQAAVPILEAASKVEELKAEQDSIVEASALTRALGLDDTQMVMAPPMTLRGLDFSDGVSMLCVLQRNRGAESQSRSPASLVFADALRRTLEDAGVTTIAATCDRRLLLAAQGDREQLVGALERFVEARLDVVVGVGRAVAEIGALRDSLCDAETAVLGDDGRSEVRVRCYEDVPLPAFLTAEVGHERLAAKVEALLAPLHAEPALYETLAALFAHKLDVSSTARALHFHPNTVRYRIAKIEAALNASLHDPAMIAALYLALSERQCEGVLSTP
jgi:purine catabolism regulator